MVIVKALLGFSFRFVIYSSGYNHIVSLCVTKDKRDINKSYTIIADMTYDQLCDYIIYHKFWFMSYDYHLHVQQSK